MNKIHAVKQLPCLKLLVGKWWCFRDFYYIKLVVSALVAAITAICKKDKTCFETR